MANKLNSLAHTKWLCKYHIVFIPKYRRKAIFNQYRRDLRDYIRLLCKYKGVEIIEGHMMPDHVHLLVSIPPKLSVSQFMGYLKGKSALMMFDRHANLKYKYGNRHFWAEGYYVSTVGLNESTIKKYIRDQEKHDIAMDKLTSVEYSGGRELTINFWFSNSKIRTMIFDRFKNHSPDFKLFMKLVSNRLIDWPNFVRFNAIRASPMSFSTARCPRR